MIRTSIPSWLVFLGTSLGFAPAATAQCLDWKSEFSYASDGIPTGCKFYCMAEHDDGTGAALYVGGQFTNLGGSGDTNNVARWTGSGWQALGNGANWLTDLNGVRGLCSFDDGSGSALYVGGWLNTESDPVPSSVARWNGSSWSFVGTAAGRVNAFLVFDDGSGPALYGFGSFVEGPPPHTTDHWHPAAKWNGSDWEMLDGGVTFSPLNALCATVFDDGSGPAIYVGGAYPMGVQKWTGSTWVPIASSFGPGFGAHVNALVVHDDGSGPALYAAGGFTVVNGGGANNIARWDGTNWTPLYSGVNSEVLSLASYDAGSGPELFACGVFTSAGDLPADGIAKWSQGAWSASLPGISYMAFNGAAAWTLFVHDPGTGPELFVGGKFSGIGGQAANGLAHGNGNAWSAIGGSGLGMPASIRALKVLDDGNGPALWAGGDFLAAGEVLANRVARWNGSGWSAVTGGVTPAGTVQALGSLQVGGAHVIYAGGGQFNTATFSKLTPQGWVQNLSGPNNTVYALETFDDGSGPKLFVGGSFNLAASVNLSGIGRFDGANWSQLSTGMDGPVFALAGFDDGSGAKLYAGGTFTTAGGVSAFHVARWSGSSWSALGNGTNGHVFELAAFDDGSGPALYAGGSFSFAGGIAANNIARWNGTSWSALGSGTNALVNGLAVFDDGSGAALYAAGDFTSAGGLSANRIAKWNGTSWSVLGSGVDNSVYALASFDDGTGGGADLFLGGAFTTAGALASSRIASWEGCGSANQTFCFGDGSLTACPCANSGLPGHGCRNSAASRGAELTPSGTSVPDALLLSVAFEPATALSIFLQGDALIPAGTFFGDGLRCTGGNLKRLYAKNASAGLVSAPTGADLPVSQRSAALGDVIPPGATRYYQVYYRDPDPSFCPAPSGATFNVSNGARILW